VTSDATQAYNLVNPDVSLVRRTVVFLKPDVLAVLDRVRLAKNPLPVQARFQVDNSDGKGSAAAEESAFTVSRPGVRARTEVRGSGDVRVRCGTIDVPADRGVFPFAEVESAPALDHVILTVCAAAAGAPGGAAPRVTRRGNVWHIAGGEGVPSVAIDASGDTPEVTIG